MSKQVMIIKPGTVSGKDKEKLSKSGYVVIEHPEPDNVKIIMPVSEIRGDDLMMAALFGLQNSSISKQYFAEELWKRLKQNETLIKNTSNEQ